MQENLNEFVFGVEIHVVDEIEALPQSGGQGARARRGAHGREYLEREVDGAGHGAAIDDEVHAVVLHRGVEEFLHRAGHPVDLVDE